MNRLLSRIDRTRTLDQPAEICRAHAQQARAPATRCSPSAPDPRPRRRLTAPARHSSGRNIGPHMSNSTYASFADASQVGTGAKMDVCAGEPDELGDPQAGLDGDHQQGVVTTADPAGAVRGGEEGVDLLVGEEGHDRPVE